jgi:amino acid transporter
MSGNGRAHLNRVLGRWDLVLLFVVAITNLNIVPSVAATGSFSVWLWLLALLLFFWPQGVAVIELSQRYPGEGGVYLWTRQELGAFHGFLSGWCYWTNNVYYVPTVLFYLVGVAAYAAGFRDPKLLEDRPLVMFGAAAGLLALLTAVNVRGLGLGKWVNNLGGVGTAVASLALIGLALAAGTGQGDAASGLLPERWSFGLVSSFGSICFALVGLELASVMGDEIREPRRVLPGAILWGGVISGVLYVGATLAILLAVPRQEIGVLNGVLQAVEKLAGEVGLPGLVSPVALVLSVSVVGICSAWFAGSARIPFVAGLDHYLPHALGRIHPRHGTPHVALQVQALLSTLVIAGSLLGATAGEAFVTLLGVAVVLQLVPYLYVFLILLRFARGDAPQPAFFRKGTLLAAGAAGLLTTGLGMGLAFYPPPQVASLLGFELKMVAGCAVFLGAAVALFVRGERARTRAARGALGASGASGAGAVP